MTPTVPPCPDCGEIDCVSENSPLFTGRKYRKQRRTGRNPVMNTVRATMHRWECSRCVIGWFTFDETPKKGDDL